MTHPPEVSCIFASRGAGSFLLSADHFRSEPRRPGARASATHLTHWHPMRVHLAPDASRYRVRSSLMRLANAIRLRQGAARGSMRSRSGSRGSGAGRAEPRLPGPGAPRVTVFACLKGRCARVCACRLRSLGESGASRTTRGNVAELRRRRYRGRSSRRRRRTRATSSGRSLHLCNSFLGAFARASMRNPKYSRP